MLTIYTNGEIELNGRATGLSVHQGKYGTEVFTPERPRYDDNGKYVGTQRYKLHAMPHKRYALSHPDGSKRTPGLLQFEVDLRELMAKMEGASAQ